MLKNIKLIDFIVKEFKTITIEPVIILNVLGWNIISGAQISTNLLMWKICHIQLNYTEDVCGNLSAAGNDDIQQEVQKYANNFMMTSQWISSVPAVIFAVIAGALSDEFGRKPLLIIPLTGYFIETFFSIANCVFIDTLPLEFFYVECISSFFGGGAMYYLGAYSYGTSVTSPEERAHRLARLDGVETIGAIIGTILSAHIFKWTGYAGTYAASGIVYGLAAIYCIFLVKEPIKPREKNTETTKEEESGESSKKKRFIFVKLLNFFVHSFTITIQGLKSVFTRERSPVLKVLIGLQYFCYALYLLGVNIYSQVYLYLSLIFDGFTGSDFALINVYFNLMSTFALMVLMPLLSVKLKIHDAMLQFIVMSSEALSYLLTPFAVKLWQFYLVQGLGCMGYCKYSIVRSLLSKCIHPSEIGKVFSMLSVIASVAPAFGSPLFRQLYNLTLNSVPGAIFFLFGGMMTIAACINLLLFTQRRHMNTGEDSDGKPKVEEHGKLHEAGHSEVVVA